MERNRSLTVAARMGRGANHGRSGTSPSTEEQPAVLVFDILNRSAARVAPYWNVHDPKKALCNYSVLDLRQRGFCASDAESRAHAGRRPRAAVTRVWFRYRKSE